MCIENRSLYTTLWGKACKQLFLTNNNTVWWVNWFCLPISISLFWYVCGRKMQCIVTKTILVSFLWCQYTIDTMKDILYVSRSGKNPQKGAVKDAQGIIGCPGEKAPDPRLQGHSPGKAPVPCLVQQGLQVMQLHSWRVAEPCRDGVWQARKRASTPWRAPCEGSWFPWILRAKRVWLPFCMTEEMVVPHCEIILERDGKNHKGGDTLHTGEGRENGATPAAGARGGANSSWVLETCPGEKVLNLEGNGRVILRLVDGYQSIRSSAGLSKVKLVRQEVIQEGGRPAAERVG